MPGDPIKENGDDQIQAVLQLGRAFLTQIEEGVNQPGMRAMTGVSMPASFGLAEGAQPNRALTMP
jgi:hypothetical protein